MQNLSMDSCGQYNPHNVNCNRNNLSFKGTVSPNVEKYIKREMEEYIMNSKNVVPHSAPVLEKFRALYKKLVDSMNKLTHEKSVLDVEEFRVPISSSETSDELRLVVRNPLLRAKTKVGRPFYSFRELINLGDGGRVGELANVDSEMFDLAQGDLRFAADEAVKGNGILRRIFGNPEIKDLKKLAMAMDEFAKDKGWELKNSCQKIIADAQENFARNKTVREVNAEMLKSPLL